MNLKAFKLGRLFFPHFLPRNSEAVIVDLSHIHLRAMRADFANEGLKVEITLANELNLQSDGWAQLAPYGDFPGVAVIANDNGTVSSFPAVQRLDRQAAEAMVANFYSLINRVKRFIKGCNIYNGHPDMPDAGDLYPDKSPKGMIVELQARDDGFYCKPAFNNEGESLLNQSRKLYFSGRWTSNELPSENGKRIFRPDVLKSAGLTARPNLPVQHVNERKPQTPPEMNKKLIIDLLAARGVTFANEAEATDEKIAAEIRKLGQTGDALAQEKATWANEKAALTANITQRDTTITTLTNERDTFRTNFQNERKARITGLLDAAITEGRITAAERADWERRLNDEAQFANESASLGRQEKKIKTGTLEHGGRKFDIANAAQRSETVKRLVAEIEKRDACDYNTAYARVQAEYPALFADMKQPEIKLPGKN